MEFLTRSQALKLSKQSKLIGFGAGVEGLQTQRLLDGAIAYFVDNSADKWDTEWPGNVPIKPVHILAGEDPGKIVVIICTEQHQIVSPQIMAINPDINIYLSPLLKDFSIFDDLLNCSRRLLVSAYGAGGGIRERRQCSCPEPVRRKCHKCRCCGQV